MVALTSTGKVLTWGQNSNGQLGAGITATTPVPHPVYVKDEEGNDITGIKQISAGATHILALTEDGEIWSWGQNNYGQLGINNTSPSKKVSAIKVQKLNDDGTLSNQTGVKQVSAGDNFSVILTEAGEAYAWGYNNYGQLGIGEVTAPKIPTRVDITDVKKVSAGGTFAVALKTDGTVWTWGYNGYGQLSIGTLSTTASNAEYKRISPVQALLGANTPLEGVKEVSAISSTGYALLENGKVYAWGLNTSGQIADNTVSNKKTGNCYATEMKTSGFGELQNIEKLVEGSNTNTNLMIDGEGNIYGNGVSSSMQLMSDRIGKTPFVLKLKEEYLELSNNQEYIEIGQTLNLSVNYKQGFNLKNKEKTIGDVKYSSSNENIATVNAQGIVTAKQIGQVTIIAENNGDIAQSIINIVSKGAVAVPSVQSGTNFTVMLKEDRNSLDSWK